MPTPIPLPTDPFTRYVPTSADPWDVKKAGHTLRRLGFGANADQLSAAPP